MTNLVPLRVLQREEVRAAVRRLAEVLVDETNAYYQQTPDDLPEDHEYSKKDFRKWLADNPGLSLAELKALDEPIQVAIWEALQGIELPVGDTAASNDQRGDAHDRNEGRNPVDCGPGGCLTFRSLE